MKAQFDALRGMLPCKDPHCSHPVERFEINDGRGSYVMQRRCAQFGPTRADWQAGFHREQAFGFKLGMIDKCGWEARVLRECGLFVRLCDFHVFAAMLKYAPAP